MLHYNLYIHIYIPTLAVFPSKKLLTSIIKIIQTGQQKLLSVQPQQQLPVCHALNKFPQSPWHYFVAISQVPTRILPIRRWVSNFQTCFLTGTIPPRSTTLQTSLLLPSDTLHMLTLWRRNYFFNFSTLCI